MQRQGKIANDCTELLFWGHQGVSAGEELPENRSRDPFADTVRGLAAVLDPAGVQMLLGDTESDWAARSQVGGARPPRRRPIKP